MVEAKKIVGTDISVYHHPNLEIRSYLMDEPIFNPVVESFRPPFDGRRDPRTLEGLGTVGAQLVREIMELQGIREIRVKPKEVRIIKEDDAPWQGIEEALIKILSSALKRKRLRRVK